MINELNLLWAPNFIALEYISFLGPNFPGMKRLILVLISNVCYLIVILIFLVVTWLVTACYLVATAGYCLFPGGYCWLLLVSWWLLLVTVRYCWLLLVTARYWSFPLLVWTRRVITFHDQTISNKLSYAAVLKRKSNANLRRKFSKQNLAENEPNNSVKNSILNARRSRSRSRNTCTKAHTAKQTENKKQGIAKWNWNSKERNLINEKRSLCNITNSHRRQLLSYSPSKLSPQKRAKTYRKNQKTGMRPPQIEANNNVIK